MSNRVYNYLKRFAGKSGKGLYLRPYKKTGGGLKKKKKRKTKQRRRK